MIELLVARILSNIPRTFRQQPPGRRTHVSGFPTKGLVGNGRVGPQVLSNRGARWVLDTSDCIAVDGDDLLACPLDQVFDRPRNPVIIVGSPNMSVILPNGEGGWSRFAAYMFWRKHSHWAKTTPPGDESQGRVQAGLWFELLDAPEEAVQALRCALRSLVGTKKASCAHTLALALHHAGFATGTGKSLRWLYRPTRLTRILWTEGLSWNGKPVELRPIQAGPMSISDHVVGAWLTERNSPSRAVQKQYCPPEPTGRAPSFPPRTETIPLKDLWTADPGEPRVRVGVSVPTRTGANLAYTLGQQPIFVVELPDDAHMEKVGEPLQAFPGELDRITWLKKNVLFRKLIVRLVRSQLMDRVDWLGEVPVSGVAEMLKLSPGPDREGAFVYNYVATSKLMFLTRLTNATSRTAVLGQWRGKLLDRLNRFIEWVMAKHVLVSGHDLDVRLPGELWAHRNPDGIITVNISGNSGTYKPHDRRLRDGAQRLRSVLPTYINVVRATEED